MRRRSLILASAAAIAGCGSSSSSAPTPTAFRAKVNAVCDQTHNKLTSLKQPTNLNDFVAYAPTYQNTLNGMAAQLAGFVPPSSMQKQYDRFISDVRSSASLIGQLGSAAQKRDVSGVQRINGQVQAAVAQGKSAAQQLGLGPSCST